MLAPNISLNSLVRDCLKQAFDGACEDLSISVLSLDQPKRNRNQGSAIDGSETRDDSDDNRFHQIRVRESKRRLSVKVGDQGAAETGHCARKRHRNDLGAPDVDAEYGRKQAIVGRGPHVPPDRQPQEYRNQRKADDSRDAD